MIARMHDNEMNKSLSFLLFLISWVLVASKKQEITLQIRELGFEI